MPLSCLLTPLCTALHRHTSNQQVFAAKVIFVSFTVRPTACKFAKSGCMWTLTTLLTLWFPCSKSFKWTRLDALLLLDRMRLQSLCILLPWLAPLHIHTLKRGLQNPCATSNEVSKRAHSSRFQNILVVLVCSCMCSCQCPHGT